MWMKVFQLHQHSQIKKKRKKKTRNNKNEPSGRKNSKKTTFSCVVEEELEEANEPEYIWMNGVLEKVIKQETVDAHDDNNHKITCRVIPNGYIKLKQMERKIKGMTKSMKKFSKTLSQITEMYDVP